MTSPKYLCLLTAALLLAGLPLAHGETLVPLQGQTQQQIQADIAACQSSASSTASSTTSSSGGERLRGAAKGAVAGAAAAEVRGQRHDGAYAKVDDDIKQEYRQEQARDTAKVGVVVGGSQQRQSRREERRNGDAATSSSSANYQSCMSSRGYSITP